MEINQRASKSTVYNNACFGIELSNSHGRVAYAFAETQRTCLRTITVKQRRKFADFDTAHMQW